MNRSKYFLPLLSLLAFGCTEPEEEEGSSAGSTIYTTNTAVFVVSIDGRFYPEGTVLDAAGIPVDPTVQPLPLVASSDGRYFAPGTQLDGNGLPMDPAAEALDYYLGADGFLYPAESAGTNASGVAVDSTGVPGGLPGPDGVGTDGDVDSCPMMCEVEVVTQETVEVEGVGCTANPYLAGEAYAGGATVSYQNKTYTAKWWTNYAPDMAPDGAWGEGEPCGNSGPVIRPVVSIELVCCDEAPTVDEEPVLEFDCILDKHLGREQFNAWFSVRPQSKYQTFYSYDNLCEALDSFSDFANTGNDANDKREIAAFFANVARETGQLQYIEEISQTVPTYYGRGPIQLTHNFNYEAAGNYIGENLLQNPDLVSSDGVISWKTGLWFWMAAAGAGKGTCHEGIHSGGGLGKTIDIINGGYECRGETSAARERITYFEGYIRDLGVDAGGPKTCW
ncbi:MAG: hypothetical protein MK135_13005 [Polyangiaceae bacterium]|nr:hypothetical protein [Polyangiaceae bacterium]